jgi:Asp-tRNA(Asn)/Glu-tRNA(Gln) amidotransferase A subunit family amidase
MRAGRLTAEERVRSCLERIAARDLDSRRGPLHGIPIGYKDVYDTAVDAIYDDQPVINEYEAARALAFEYENHREQLSELILENIERGRRVSRERYDAATRNAAHCRELLARMMTAFDFVLTPAAPGEAPEGIARTGNAIFNRAWTLLGVPCVTVLAYTGPRGLPIGMQIVGAYSRDSQTLAWAR